MFIILTLERLLTVSHNILINKLMKYGLDIWIVGWTEKLLNH